MDTTSAVRMAVAKRPHALFVSSLGTATSALRKATDDGPHLYLGGAMGSGLAVALGVAHNSSNTEVVAVIGDGDLLMGAGSLWDLASLRPANLTVVVLSDGAYSITGGQTLGCPARAQAVALALGLAAGAADDEDELAELLSDMNIRVIEANVQPGAPWPGPSPFVDPWLVKHRLRQALDSDRGADRWSSNASM